MTDSVEESDLTTFSSEGGVFESGRNSEVELDLDETPSLPPTKPTFAKPVKRATVKKSSHAAQISTAQPSLLNPWFRTLVLTRSFQSFHRSLLSPNTKTHGDGNRASHHIIVPV